jgi:hypothetical protein
MMLTHRGGYVCALCGVEIDVTPDQQPLVLIKASSGEPNVRVVMLDGKQVHSCPMKPDARTHL